MCDESWREAREWLGWEKSAQMFEQGYLTVGRWRGAPIRLHFSLPLGALLFSGFRFEPVFWVAFFGLVLIHEFGHAMVARRLGQTVLSIDVTGFGGICRWAGSATDYDRSRIAWGGVAAQAVVLAVAVAVAFALPAEGSLLRAQLLSVFIGTNLWLMALNLLPLAPLDGAQAWRLPGQLLARHRGRRILRGIHTGAEVRPTRSRPRTRSAPTSPTPSREMADFLRRISEEAADARRGGSSDRHN